MIGFEVAGGEYVWRCPLGSLIPRPSRKGVLGVACPSEEPVLNLRRSSDATCTRASRPKKGDFMGAVWEDEAGGTCVFIGVGWEWERMWTACGCEVGEMEVEERGERMGERTWNGELE